MIRAGQRFAMLSLLLLLGAAPAMDPQATIHLVGDSTMANKPAIDNPERGWGQLLGMFFKEGVVIRNHARNGRSTKSFIDEGRWQSVLEELKPGDYVFIQFGHNDGKAEDPKRYAAARTDYRANLIQMIHDTKARNATPVLLTPIVRRKYDKDGALVDTHAEYPSVVREVAFEENVLLIDLEKESREVVQAAGTEGSKELFLHVAPGVSSRFPQGKADNTHFRARGAYTMASLIASALRKSEVSLGSELREVSEGEAKGVGKIVTLDYYFNNEWRKGKDSLERYHYVWEDTTNSGFSELGRLFVERGANIETLTSAPSVETLGRSDIYIIVDPDTPAETKEPNYISTENGDEIASWVRNGGTLLLMSNDKGNSEFEHFNALSGRFGIRFNEDSHHRVVGKEYETGAFTELPDHPLFRKVQKIYMKEACSIELEPPAVAILEEDQRIFIAVAPLGKGRVVAIGDPWLYNEYIDWRRLPRDFENMKAAKNLVCWLLE